MMVITKQCPDHLTPQENRFRMQKLRSSLPITINYAAYCRKSNRRYYDQQFVPFQIKKLKWTVMRLSIKKIKQGQKRTISQEFRKLSVQ